MAELSRDLKAQQDDLQTKTKKANDKGRDQLKVLDRLQTLAVQAPDDRSVLGDIELVKGAEDAKALIAEKQELSRATLRVTRDLYGLVITPIDRAASHLTCDDKFGKALAKAEYDVALANSRAVSVSNDDTSAKDVAELTNSLDTFNKAQAATERDDARKALIAVVAKTADDGKRLADVVGKQAQEQSAAAKSAQDVLTAFTVCQTQSDRPKSDPEYDPFTLISHQVSFVVAGNGSLSPAWKLARVTAPTTGTLAAGGRKNTNTLIIAMGRSGEAVKQQVQTQQLRSAFMQ